MKRSIIIIDDFYSEPEKVRHIALNSSFPDPESTYTYPGKNSQDNHYPPELHNKFESILNRKLTPAQPNGYFRLSLESDSCLLYTSPSPRDKRQSRMPSSA